MNSSNIGRNDPCPCGSGRKYKQCCMNVAPREGTSDAASIARLLQAGLAHHRAGRLSAAAGVYSQILAVQPKHADALNLLGVIATQAGRADDAVRFIQAAIAETPSNASFYNNLGNALQGQGKMQDAVGAYQKALALQPNDADTHFNLGGLLARLERYGEAEASYRRALDLQPAMAEGHNNLGFVLHRQWKFPEAVASYGKAIARAPQYAEAHSNLGNVRRDQGDYEAAKASLQQALSLKPDYAEAHYNLGNVFLETGQLTEAAVSFQKAIESNPKLAVAHDNLGTAFRKLGRFDEALASHRNAIRIDPAFAGAHCNLGAALQEQGHFGEAVESYKRALSIRPDYAEAYYNLGTAYQDLDRLADAIASYEKALELKPTLVAAYSNLLYIHATVRDISPEQEVALARKWEQFALDERARNEARNRKFVRSPREGRRLKIGIVSAEIGEHAVAEFLEPLLQTLDRQRCHLTLFPTVLRPGDRALRIQALADAVHPVARLSDARAADFMRSCDIDVLMDTTGHTRNCRLGIFAHRAAPVQLTYLGYWSTTGLTEMDWYLADDHIHPEFENHFSEGIWRLPRVAICYRGDATLESNWKPDSNGTIWLGSFNRYIKIGEASLELWGKVMNALPESKLLLEDRKADDSDAHRRICASLARNGIAPERIVFELSIPGHERHMLLYNRLDIALDTVPFSSGTTACDALWMAVPLVTIEGDWAGGTIASSFLRAIGRPEWVVKNKADYVAIVCALARDVPLRRELRSKQRQRVINSPLLDAAGLARAVEDAFEQMFDQWLAKQPSARE
ncbi:MAG: tetratricopeptide repeat protein [Terriglobales bacterium]